MNRKLKSSIVLRFLTQEDFAAAVKESPSVVSRAIRGRITLSPEKKALWADTLGFEVNHLFQGTDNPESGGK